jgi:hypothetical protein
MGAVLWRAEAGRPIRWLAALAACAAVVVSCGGKESEAPPYNQAGMSGTGGDQAAGPSCSDGITNQGETDVDCGGPCGGCADGLRCNLSDDCMSQLCSQELCVAASCADLVKNGDETDIDCGGACAPCRFGCCVTDTDCESFVCLDSCCAAPSCSDHTKNGSETDTDCGGGECPACAAGSSCVEAPDCLSGLCSNERCS